MALIDERILIPAPMTAVWEIIEDHAQLPRWRVDVKAVSLLSTNSEGVGVRRRITPVKSRRDFIEEIKAWYNGFGYEYSIVDTKKYSYNLFRIRLQATPDGTIVQWTTEFEVRGFLARLIGRRQRRRQLNHLMIASLRELRRYVVAQGVPIDDNYRTKTGVQQAPDVDRRAEYGAQIFEQVEQRKPPAEETPEPAIEEPPVRVDDTPSVPRVAPPSFVTSNFDVREHEIPAPKQEDTRPSAPVVITNEMATSSKQVDTLASTPEESAQTTISVSEEKDHSAEGVDEPAKTIVTRQTGEMTPPPISRIEAEPAAADSNVNVSQEIPEPIVEKRDTDSMSIWEVFGIERPDEIGEPTPVPSGGLSAEDSIADLPVTVVNPAPSLEAETAQTVPPTEVDTRAEKPVSIDELLALEEPPIPRSASITVKTYVRPTTSQLIVTTGLRKKSRRNRLRVRLPRPFSKAEK
jgi:hypothetical protein